ncbi:MAG: 30S ribosomal protein S27e [Thermoplasmatota archaeon]
MAKPFVKVKCEDCGNEQITFKCVSSYVNCQICGARLAEPTGGYSNFKGEVIEELTEEEEKEEGE